MPASRSPSGPIAFRSAAARRRTSMAIAASNACSSASRKSGATRCATPPASNVSRSTRIRPDSSAPTARCATRVPSPMPLRSSRATRCICRRSSGYRCGRRTVKWCARKRSVSAAPRATPFDRWNWLAAVSAPAGLTLDDLFGQKDQHLLGSQISHILKSPQQAQREHRLQRIDALRRRKICRFPVGANGLAVEEVDRYLQCVGDLHQAVRVDVRRSAVFRCQLKRATENFGQIGLRKPDRKPSCLHELVYVSVRGAARHRLVPLVRSGKIRTTFGRDIFLKPANKFTSGSASLYDLCKSFGWTNSSRNHGYLRPSNDWMVHSINCLTRGIFFASG